MAYDLGDGSIPIDTGSSPVPAGAAVYGSRDPFVTPPVPFSQAAMANWLAASIKALLALTTSDISGYVAPTPQVNSDWDAVSGVAQILNKPSIPAAQVNSDWNAVSGPAEILNKPSIVGQQSSDWNSNVAPTQILNKPSIPAAQVNSDWNASGTVAEILNKPTIVSIVKAVVAHQFLTGIAANGTVYAAQPNFTDLAGILSALQAYDLISQDVSTSSGTVNIDLNNGRYVILTLNHTVTSMVVTNWRPNGQVDKMILEVRNTGAYNITDWDNALPIANTYPTVTSGAGKIDRFIISSGDGGLTRLLSIEGQDYRSTTAIVLQLPALGHWEDESTWDDTQNWSDS